MKRTILTTVFAFVMFASVPVYAIDRTSAQKDECLLATKECKDIVDSVQKKAEKLKTEIEKGNKVYTPEEILTLKAKLKEVETILDNYLND